MMTICLFFWHLMTFFWTYSAYKKSSYPFISFTFLLCCIIILNCIKLLFFLHINRHPFTIMTKKKQDLSQLANLLKRKHWKNDIAQVFFCFDTWNVDQEHSSLTVSILWLELTCGKFSWTNQICLEKPINGCPPMVPRQPERAWDDLKRRIKKAEVQSLLHNT